MFKWNIIRMFFDIYIVVHRQICFVLSELISLTRFLKLGSKPSWFKCQSKILQLSHEEGSASEVNLNGYESQLWLDISTLDGTFFETGWQIHLPRKQRLINRKRHWHTANDGMGQLSIGFRSYGNQTWPIKWNAVSSRLRSCRYCYMDALLGRWLNGWRRS